MTTKSASSAGGPFWNASSWAAGRSGRSAQFCSEVAHPTRFERVAFAFGARPAHIARSTSVISQKATLPVAFSAIDASHNEIAWVFSCSTHIFNAREERRRDEIPRTDPLIQVDFVRVVNLDVGASKSDICAIRVATISERAGRTRTCKPRVGAETAMENVESTRVTTRPLARTSASITPYSSGVIGSRRPSRTSSRLASSRPQSIARPVRSSGDDAGRYWIFASKE
jgi:hypothetical protein